MGLRYSLMKMQKLIKMVVRYEGKKRLLCFKDGGDIANTLTCHCGDATCDVSSLNAVLVTEDDETNTDTDIQRTR